MPSEIKCKYCGSKKIVPTYRIKLGLAKYCSSKCSQLSQKGRKLPHSKEWEEKRLDAIRLASSKKVYPKGWNHTVESRKKMSEKIKESIAKDPDKKREQAIKNLPKNNKGENNGNWRGGIAREKRTNISWSKYELWKKKVKQRDNWKCRDCGSTENLTAHHIVAIKDYDELAILPMNGVTLCRNCHQKTESWGGNKKIKDGITRIGKLKWLIITIPHRYQEYNTLGNYAKTESGIKVIFVSDLGNSKYEYLIGVHEFIESELCDKDGISYDEITRFDIEFERKKNIGEVEIDSEPGDDPMAPYYKQHKFASAAEKAMCIGLGLDWTAYERFLNEFIAKNMEGKK